MTCFDSTGSQEVFYGLDLVFVWAQAFLCENVTRVPEGGFAKVTFQSFKVSPTSATLVNTLLRPNGITLNLHKLV